MRWPSWKRCSRSAIANRASEPDARTAPNRGGTADSVSLQRRCPGPAPGLLGAAPSARGSSIVPGRSRRNCVMRRAICLSNPRRSFSAPASNSIRQAKLALHFLQRTGSRPSGPVVDQALFGEVQVLELVKMLEDPGLRGCGAAASARRVQVASGEPGRGPCGPAVRTRDGAAAPCERSAASRGRCWVTGCRTEREIRQPVPQLVSCPANTRYIKRPWWISDPCFHCHILVGLHACA